MNNWIIGITCIVLIFICIKIKIKPTIIVFILATATMAILVLGNLLKTDLPWIVGAGTLWFIVFIVAIIAARKYAKFVIPFILIATLAIGGITYFAPKANAEEQKDNTDANTQNQQEAVTLDNFKPDFIQVPLDNAGNKVDASWESSIAQSLVANSDYSEAFKLTLLQKTSSNAQLFAIWANAVGIYDDPNNWQPLVEGDKLSPKAQQLWWKFAGIIQVSKVKKTEANASGTNTGVSNGTYGTAGDGGIGGDRTATEVTLNNGDVLVNLNRCGNFVLPGKSPSLPTVPTDNPPPGPNPPTETGKDPTKDVNVNPAVDPVKQDDIVSGNEPEHTVSNENGASVSNGYQANPVQDAANAVSDADAANAGNAASQNEAVDQATDTGGGNTGNGSGQTEATKPDSQW